LGSFDNNVTRLAIQGLVCVFLTEPTSFSQVPAASAVQSQVSNSNEKRFTKVAAAMSRVKQRHGSPPLLVNHFSMLMHTQLGQPEDVVESLRCYV
jgi:hypothetical protein